MQIKAEPTAAALSIARNAPSFGNKSANLIALQDILPDNVPSFCPLDNESLQRHLDQYSKNNWRDLLKAFQDAQGQETSKIQDQAVHILKKLRHEIMETFSNHPIEDERLKAFLLSLQDQSATLMVRSTGEEDTLDLANPGGNESVAAVLPNIEAISIAMGRVIASYFSEKSLQQRLLSQNDIASDKIFIPVLIQEMIGEPLNGCDEPDGMVRSGVMYTGEAFTRIQVAPGHGEFVVNSQGLFDTYTVTRENMVYPEIRVKKYRLVPAHDGLQLKENPKAIQQGLSVSSDVAQQLADIGRKMEAYYGMPMDVEFTYEPQKKKISIVQARPIPAGKVKAIVPSSVPSDHMSVLKAHIAAGKISKQPAQVITPAGFATQLITNSDEILICSHLSDALTLYLNQPGSPIKAVIVQNLAPPNSHEAAQFNLMAIPVLQVDDITTITAWSGPEKPLLMVDPQRSQILNLKTLVPDSLSPNDYLREQGLLADGLFTFPIVPTTSLPFSIRSEPTDSNRLVDQLESRPEETLKPVFEKIPQNKPVGIDSYHIYTQLLSNIEVLEDGPSSDVSSALSQIRYVLGRFAKRNASEAAFFPQAMIVCEEIERSIQRIADTSVENKDEVRMLRAEHLELVARLKSLVSFSGARDTFSNSLKQVVQEDASKKSVDKDYYKGLDEGQAKYLTQFLKLNKIAFNTESQKRWANFVRSCIFHKVTIPVLASVVKFYTENQLESDLINHDLAPLIARHSSPVMVLQELHHNVTQAQEALATLKLDEKRNTMEAWMHRAHEWENPEQFDQLWQEYQRDILPLIEQLQLNTGKTYSQITQKAILNLALSLTDMMDATIKSLKRTPTKSSEKQEEMVDRFVTLLNPYHALMTHWVNAVPNDAIAAVFVGEGGGDGGGFTTATAYKQMMIDNVQSVLSRSTREPKELTSSGDFSVASAKIGSSANFTRQFTNKMHSITFEDIFSLMHQNTLASISMIQQQRFPKDMASLPLEIQTFLKKAQKSKLDLLSIKHQFPIVVFDFNLPMRNHSASFTFEYNQVTQAVTLHGHFFGHNSEGRMNELMKFITFDADVMNISQTKIPSYCEKSQSLDFSWTFIVHDLETGADKFLKNFARYDMLLTELTRSASIKALRERVNLSYINDFVFDGRLDCITKIKDWRTLIHDSSGMYLEFDVLTEQETRDYLHQTTAFLNTMNDATMTIFIIKILMNSISEDKLTEFLDTVAMFKQPTGDDIRYLFEQMKAMGTADMKFLATYLAKNTECLAYLESHSGTTLLSLAQPYSPRLYDTLQQAMLAHPQETIASKATDIKTALQVMKHGEENTTPTQSGPPT